MENKTMKTKCTMTVMQQIEDLKSWHKQQEKLFQKDQLQNQDYNHRFKTKADSNFPALKYNETNLSQSIGITPGSNTDKSNNSHDEMPIKSSCSDFNRLIDYKIGDNNNAGIDCEGNGSKPKRKFLRKGEGIARFKMAPKKPQTIKSKTFQTQDTKKETNPVVKADSAVTETKQAGDDNYFASTKTSETIPLDWKTLLTSMLSSNKNGYFNLDSSIQTDCLPDSFIEKIANVGKKNAREREEIKVFELLEQHALDSSFCSSSSTVMRLMENSIKSTPVKEKPPTIHENLTNNFHQRELDQFENNAERKTGSQIENRTAKDQPNAVEQSPHVRFREENSYRSFIDYTDPNLLEEESKIPEENYFGDEKQWSEEDCDCDCSTEYSSSDDDTRPISPPDYPGCESIVTVEIKPSKKKEGDNVVDQSRKQFEINGENRTLKAVENTYLRDENMENRNEIRKQFEINGENRTLKGVENTYLRDESMENRNEIQDLAGKNLHQSSELQNRSAIINLRLKELEDEIDIFRKENAKLKKLQSDFEQEYKLFVNDKKMFFSKIDEEKRKNLDFLEAEKQKLLKEKLVFEKYTKNLNKNPNKEERKEIQILKEQLMAIKDELSKKESRWGAAQARVRNQVKLLEEDNKKLRQEIEGIRKQSQKVNKSKTERKSNTRLLHTISQQLSQISPRDLAETFSAKDELKPDKKQTEQRKVKPNQPTKIMPENMHQDLSSNSGDEYVDAVEKTNLLKRDIRKTIEEAMFEPIMTAFNLKEKILRKNPEISDSQNSEEPLKEDSVGEHLKRTYEPEQSDIIEERTNQDGNKEVHYKDGRKEIRYKNGNIKKISPNGEIIKIVYFNGDVKEICKDGTVKYYFGESRIWHTTYPDGLEVLDFPTGQVERRHLNGTVEVLYPNKCRKLNYTDGSEEWIYKDGTVLKIDSEKQSILTLPNGQKEIHTEEHKRREYPDGTVKLIYPDGTQETRYSNGRIRLKDKDGNLVMDSG